MRKAPWIKLVFIVGAHATEADANNGGPCIYDEHPYITAAIMTPRADREDFVKQVTTLDRDIYEKIKEYRGWKFESKSGLILPPSDFGRLH